MATQELIELDDVLRFEDTSRWRFAKLFEDDFSFDGTSKWGKVRFMGTWTAPATKGGVGDQYHKVTAKDEYRLDRISHQFYGTSHLAWILVLVNDLLDPIQDIEAGRTLRIPSAARIFAEILA